MTHGRPGRERAEVEDDVRILVALVPQPVAHVDRHEEPMPRRNVVPLSVELRDKASVHDVDELFGEGVVVLGDPVSGSDRRHPHEARGASDALRAQKRPDVAAAPRVRRDVVRRANRRLVILCHHSSFVSGRFPRRL